MTLHKEAATYVADIVVREIAFSMLARSLPVPCKYRFARHRPRGTTLERRVVKAFTHKNAARDVASGPGGHVRVSDTPMIASAPTHTKGTRSGLTQVFDRPLATPIGHTDFAGRHQSVCPHGPTSPPLSGAGGRVRAGHASDEGADDSVACRRRHRLTRSQPVTRRPS